MNIIKLNPLSDPRWQDFVAQCPSSVFHSPAWIRVVTETYEFNSHALLALGETGEAKAGIAYCRVEEVMDPRVVSLPFSDYCDPLVDNVDGWRCLSNELLAEGCLIRLRCLHNPVPLEDERFALVNRAKWHGVDLEPDLGAIWQGLDSSARRAISKAQRDGVIVRPAERKDDLRAFFALHLRVRKYKYRLLAQPYAFFEKIWEHFIAKQKGVLMMALYQGKLIGGVLFLEWQNKLYYKFNASEPEHLFHRPNDLLIWEGIKYGHGKGYTHLDLGLSDWDQEGLIRYKNKFAGQEKTISFLQYTPHETPSQNERQVRRLLPQLTDLFTDASVTDTVTEKAGEVLYRFFV
jgi:CelD/BcsL family acetyltransferase involved in cellulose biosynthesis